MIEFINNNKSKHDIKTMCTVIGVARSTYYKSSDKTKSAKENEILAYNLSDRITLDIATNTIHKLIENPNVKLAKDVFIHSDQGSHYTIPTFQKLLKSKKLGQSMSILGNHWDNAPRESFFGHMKDEINYKSCSTLEELQLIIDNRSIICA